MAEYRHYPATKAEREQRETGWDNPRDDDRRPEARDPDMDRWTIGTNAVPEQRNGK
jgi:hypothetical protein